MTVRFPFRISTTCEALLVSFASLPATKKPQNAAAGRTGQTTRAATTASARTTDRTTDRFKDMPPPQVQLRQPETRTPPEGSPGERIYWNSGGRHQRAGLAYVLHGRALSARLAR